MNNEEIILKLKNSGLSEVKRVEQYEEHFVLSFFYDLDEDELDAAEAYAEDECAEDDEDAWYDEFYIPYLTDIAVDNVGEIIEEIMEEFNVKGQYIAYEMDRESDYVEFTALFSKDDVNIEDVVKE